MTPSIQLSKKFRTACVSGVLSLLLLAFAIPADAQTNHAVTIDEALEAPQIGGLALSPDGQHVVYDVTRTNWKANAFEHDLWIVDRAGKSFLLTTQAKTSSGAKWSPDGKWIAFLSDRPGQIAETKADTMQTLRESIRRAAKRGRRVTKLEDGVSEVLSGLRTLSTSRLRRRMKSRRRRKGPEGALRRLHRCLYR